MRFMITSVLIIGSNARVMDEMRLINRNDFDVIIGVNMASLMFHPVDYLCTLQPEFYCRFKMPGLLMISDRQINGIVDEVFSCNWDGIDLKKHHVSGLYAVKYALEVLHATKIVLAGMGIDDCGHIYNEESLFTPSMAKRQRAWVAAYPKLKGKVHSLGGWTKELLNG